MKSFRQLAKYAACIGLFLVACQVTAFAAPQDDSPSTIPPTIIVDSASLAPIVTATSAVTMSMAQTPQAETTEPTLQPTEEIPDTSGARPCQVDDINVRYEVDTEVNLTTHVLNTTMVVRFTNDTRTTLNEVVFNADLNRVPGAFTLNGVSSSLQVTETTLEEARLTVKLGKALRPGCTGIFSMSFSAQAVQVAEARRAIFSITAEQFNIGDWLPEVAPYMDGAWITPQSWFIGEYVVSRMADYRVRVRLTGVPESLPQTVIAPGEMTQISADTWEFDAPALRTFTLCISPNMTRHSVLTNGGITIDLYTFTRPPVQYTPDGTPVAAADHALIVAARAVDLYTELFGELPYRRLVIVEGDFPDGMEYSGMVYVGTKWFVNFEGLPDSWLTLITAHEIAHQWWYSLVNTDQANAPYMDEALALYSELLYVERYHPDLRLWWWGFRINMYQPEGYVDSNVYEYFNVRLYINAVYLRGAELFQGVRDAIGDPAFFRWLKDYATHGRNKIVTPADLWGKLSPDEYERTATVRSVYLRDPNPVRR